jgi:WD40 repeat protein
MNPRQYASLVFLCVLSGALSAAELPPRAIAQIGSHRFYHGPGIKCAALSPDGTRVASIAEAPRLVDQRQVTERTIVLWDAVTGERIREVQSPSGALSHVVFSPDGKLLAAICNVAPKRSCAVIFDSATGKVRQQFGEFGIVVYQEFSRDGKQLHVSELEGAVSAWEVSSGKQQRRWESPLPLADEQGNFELHRRRGRLALDGKVVIWVRAVLLKQKDWLHGCSGISCFDARTNKLLYKKTLDRKPDALSVSFSSDGKRMAARLDKLRVWDTDGGKELLAIDVPDLETFTLTPDGRHALICDTQNRVSLWDLEKGKPLRDISPGFLPIDHNVLQTQPTFSADGKTLILAAGSTLRVFETATGKERIIPGHRSPVMPHFSTDGQTLFTNCEELRCRWDVSGKDPKLLSQDKRQSWELKRMRISPDGRLFLDYQNGRVRLRDTATGRVLRELEKYDVPADSAWFSPSASRILIRHAEDDDKRNKPGFKETYRLYDAKTGKATGEFVAEFDRGNPFFSPNERLVVWHDEASTVHLHDAVTGKPVRTLQTVEDAEDATNLNIRFSADSAQLLIRPYVSICIIDSEVMFHNHSVMQPARVFDIASGKLVRSLYLDPARTSKGALLTTAAWSPDGRLLALAEEGSGVIRLLEIASGKVRAEFAGHRDGVHGLAFSPDGKTLASGGEDNVVFLWDVTGEQDQKAARRELPACWTDLTSEDGKRAGAAMASLIRTPDQGITLLRKQLHPAEPLDEKRIAQLLSDLDTRNFPRREAASRELARMGTRVEPALRRALKDAETLEMRRRLESVLKQLEHNELSPETLREVRAIEALEHIATVPARQLLETLAKGAADARLTQEAKAALTRLNRMSASK